MELVGYSLAFIVGIGMGLLGAGSSILCSALMIYIFGVNPILSASYTLLNVAIISLIGTMQYYRKSLVSVPTGLIFSMPAIATVLCMRSFVMPSVPAVLLEHHGLVVSKELCMMVGFAILMIVIAWKMIRDPNRGHQSGSKAFVFFAAVFVGVLTGAVGIGGGFLIVPALLFTGLAMKTAVGTSLFIITLNTVAGFISDFSSGVGYDWMFLSKFIAVGVAGMLISGSLVEKIKTEKLKKAFGIVILAAGFWILFKELLLEQKRIIHDNSPANRCVCPTTGPAVEMNSIFLGILE